MNHTTNYSLPQWEDSDRVTRGDVNSAMAAIDAALAGAGPKIALGLYTGTGTSQTVEVGFPLKAVIVRGYDDDGHEKVHLATTEKAARGGINSSIDYIRITGTGFYVIHNGTYPYTNTSNVVYSYLAIG